MGVSKSAAEILAVPRGDITVSHAIVLDWYDGPIEGYLKFEVLPTAWRFKLFAEHSEDEDSDSRIYLLSEVPVELWDRLSESVRNQVSSTSVMWVPSWQFESDDDRAAADDVVAGLEDSAGPPELMIRASATMVISEAWVIRVPGS